MDHTSQGWKKKGLLLSNSWKRWMTGLLLATHGRGKVLKEKVSSCPAHWDLVWEAGLSALVYSSTQCMGEISGVGVRSKGRHLTAPAALLHLVHCTVQYTVQYNVHCTLYIVQLCALQNKTWSKIITLQHQQGNINILWILWFDNTTSNTSRGQLRI